MTFKALINRFPSNSWLAERLPVSEVTVRQWGNRKSIPSEYWANIVALGSEAGVSISLQDLATVSVTEKACREAEKARKKASAA